MIVWVDGVLADARDARVSPLDQGLLTGDGVFETLRVLDGAPFAPSRHLDRLARAAAGMGLRCPPAADVLDAITAVVAANDLTDGRLRVTITRGVAAYGGDRANATPTVIVTGGPFPAWPAAADVAVAPWPRNERGALAGIKSVSYGENVVALAHAHAVGAGEAVFGNIAGNLCEGTGTNVFLAVGGRLLTPPLTSGCLPGVTRQLVVELVDVVEGDVPLTALASADEAFLTSTTRDVQPVRSVDGRALPACPGPLTIAAAAAFAALVASNRDP